MKTLIADLLGVDRATITPDQPGQHKPRLWQDGESVFVVLAPSSPLPDGRWRVLGERGGRFVYERLNCEDT